MKRLSIEAREAIEAIKAGALVIAIAAGFVWCLDRWVFFDGVPGLFW